MPRTEIANLRISVSERSFIDAAAKVAGLTRSGFLRVGALTLANAVATDGGFRKELRALGDAQEAELAELAMRYGPDVHRSGERKIKATAEGPSGSQIGKNVPKAGHGM